MVTYNTEKGFTFNHFVEFTGDGCLFGAGREQESGKTRLYLIFNHLGRIYTRHQDTWQPLGEAEERTVRQSAETAKQSGVPCYSTHRHFWDFQ